MTRVGQEAPLSTGMLVAWTVVGALALAIPFFTLNPPAMGQAARRRRRR